MSALGEIQRLARHLAAQPDDEDAQAAMYRALGRQNAERSGDVMFNPRDGDDCERALAALQDAGMPLLLVHGMERWRRGEWQRGLSFRLVEIRHDVMRYELPHWRTSNPYYEPRIMLEIEGVPASASIYEQMLDGPRRITVAHDDDDEIDDLGRGW